MTCANKGFNCRHPCPQCLVRKENQSDLLSESTPRTQAETKALYMQAADAYQKGDKSQGDDLLDAHSLYPIRVREFITGI